MFVLVDSNNKKMFFGVDHTNKEIFIKRLKNRLSELDLSGIRLSIYMGVTRQYVSKLTNGHFKTVPQPIIDSLAIYLGCTKEYLTGKVSQKNQVISDEAILNNPFTKYKEIDTIPRDLQHAMAMAYKNNREFADLVGKCQNTLGKDSILVLCDIMKSFTDHFQKKDDCSYIKKAYQKSVKDLQPDL
jgi:hypothetical protein